MAATPQAGERRVALSKKVSKTSQKKKSAPKPLPTIDQRTFELVHANSSALTPKDTANVTSAINRALHQRGICDIRVDRVRCTDRARLIGTTSPTSSLQDLLQYRDMVLRAARTVLSDIPGIVPRQRWKWIRIHNVPLSAI